jgi:lipoate-protein ligase A
LNEAGWASEVHADPMLYADARTARIVDVTRSALVLGSSQRLELANIAALESFDAELVVRRSGGGAVFLSPMGQLWVDIAIPRPDPLFVEDVGKSFFAIGEIFLKLLSSLGGHDLKMHTGKLIGGDLARAICFAGLGPGEITFEGSKVVGMSQRRNAQGAVFQCVVYLTYPFDQLNQLMNGMNIEFPGRGYALGVSEILDKFADLNPAVALSQLRRSLIESLDDIS